MASLSLSHNYVIASEVWPCGCLFKRININLWQSNKYVFLILAFRMLHNLFLVNSERILRFGSLCKLDTPGQRSYTHSLCLLVFHVSLAAFTQWSSFSHLFLTSKSQYLLVFLSLCPFMKYLEVSLSSEPFSFNNLNTLISTWILFIYSLNMFTCNQYL